MVTRCKRLKNTTRKMAVFFGDENNGDDDKYESTVNLLYII